VLVTGCDGLIGRILVPALSDGRDVRGVDRRPLGWRSMTRYATVRSAFRDRDAVVHLAGLVRDDWRSAYRNDLRAVWNALSASAEMGVRRFVYASSNHVVGGYEQDEPYASIVAGRYEGLDPTTLRRITVEAPLRPDGPYAVARAAGEAAARFFADRHGMSIICLRIGTVNRADRPEDPRQFATLLTHRDLIDLVIRSVDAPADLPFTTVFGVSDNRWRFWDLEGARDVLGYQPKDDAERWR
jgi:nucleoside-diphosphate-sugar epimerase